MPEPNKIVPPHPMSDRITAEYLRLVCDDPGIGNGSHRYKVIADDPAYNGERVLLDIQFQHGAIAEVGLNGVLTGTIIQILIHHLRGFQTGQFPSRETAIVITKLEEDLQWTKQRELERAQRGVLGTATK